MQQHHLFLIAFEAGYYHIKCLEQEGRGGQLHQSMKSATVIQPSVSLERRKVKFQKNLSNHEKT